MYLPLGKKKHHTAIKKPNFIVFTYLVLIRHTT